MEPLTLAAVDSNSNVDEVGGDANLSACINRFSVGYQHWVLVSYHILEL